MPIFRRRFDQDYYDSLIYRTDPRSPRNRMRLDLVSAHMPGGRLLDIGIGRGDLIRLAAARFDVQAMDVSPHAASGLPPGLRRRVMVGDIEASQIPEPPYDVVTAFNLLEHLRRPLAVIRKVRRALKPGGVFIGSMPSNTHVIGALHTAITNYFDKTHRSCYKVSTWRKAFSRAGLGDTHFFGEIMLDGVLCKYIDTPLWPHIALNVMFVARKTTD
jgi:2-polyprenyl-3-methyl-5-hydroxy-6-metoxy-1,4-benzoquinol methylase